MAPDEIRVGRIYIGPYGEQRRVIRFGHTPEWVIWERPNERHLGKGPHTTSTTRASFARWARRAEGDIE